MILLSFRFSPGSQGGYLENMENSLRGGIGVVVKRDARASILHREGCEMGDCGAHRIRRPEEGQHGCRYLEGWDLVLYRCVQGSNCSSSKFKYRIGSIPRRLVLTDM
jgi:hypothetical protein